MILQSIVKLLRYLLWPFSLLYGLVLSIRNLFFDTGIFESTSYDIPVIAVGNLSVGGTGKTPQIEYFIRLLQNDYNIAVLSRGYMRKSEGFVLANENTTVAEIGDEPFQFFQKFKNIKVAVDADRTNGIQQLLHTDPSIDLILLDDAYQHRKVKASIYVLLTAYDNRYTNDFVLPLGDLREARSGAKRSNAIVVTKCPNNLSVEEKHKVIDEIKPMKHQQVFFSSIGYDDEIRSDKEIVKFSELKDYEIVLVTGIAKPQPLLNYLTTLNVKFRHLDFPDHHNFNDADIDKIQNSYKSIESSKKLILTTEKDYTRLSGFVDNLYSLGIRSAIEQSDQFDHFIKGEISK